MDLLFFAGVNEFCFDTANIWQLVGWIFMVFKIVIPILLIIFGMVDLGKAVVSSKEDEIKKATGSLVRRAIAGVIIFFIPTIISFIWGIVDFSDKDSAGNKPWDYCRKCVSNPGGECDVWAIEARNK